MSFVPGRGNSSPKIVFVTDAPLAEDVGSQITLSGSVGKFFDRMLLDAGIKREEVWVTSWTKRVVPPNYGDKKIPFKHRASTIGIDLDDCTNKLRTELQTLRPNIVVPLGNDALYAITGKSGISKMRGSKILGMGFKCIATYKPDDILYQRGDVRGYWNKAIAVLDFKKIKRESANNSFVLPNRILHVAKSSYDFYEFIQHNANRRNPAIDIEARNCIPICIGISFDPKYGITIPLWNTNDISTIPTADIVNLWKLLADFLSTQDVVGQNFGYDRDKIKRLGFIVRMLFSDTMLKAHAIHPELPKNLAYLTSIYTDEPYYKDEGMYEGSINDLMIGCARDACVTKEVDITMDSDLDEIGTRDYYNNFLMPLHSLYAGMENRGIKRDEQLHKGLIKKYIEWDEQIRYELFQITGEYLNTGSPKQVAELLFDKWGLPRRAGTGEEELTALLNNNVKDPVKARGIELILRSRRVKKTINSYLYAPVDFDGRHRTSYFLCLKTGRSSTQQLEPPIRPYIKSRDEAGKKIESAIGLAFQTITKHGEIGPDIRTMLVPDDGYVFISVDSAQAEARVIFLLAEDYEALEAIDTHDYHALTASWFVGGTEDDWSKKKLGYEHPNRFLGKTLRHAGHLGASGKRAMIETNTQARKFNIDVRLSENQAKKALEIFHTKQPKIKNVFQQAVRDCLEANRRLIAPVPYGIDAKVGGVRTFFERWNEDLFREAFSYIPQRSVSENTKGAALRISGNRERGIVGRAPWIQVLVEAHDGLLTQVPIGSELEAAKILRDEMQVPIDFSTCSIKRGKLVIPAEVEIGTDYYNLEKFIWKKYEAQQ